MNVIHYLFDVALLAALGWLAWTGDKLQAFAFGFLLGGVVTVAYVVLSVTHV